MLMPTAMQRPTAMPTLTPILMRMTSMKKLKSAQDQGQEQGSSAKSTKWAKLADIRGIVAPTRKLGVGTKTLT